MTKLSYKTSRDYARLVELMRSGERMICIIDHYLIDGSTCRVISETEYDNDVANGEAFFVEIRWLSSVGANTESEFIERCKKLNVEFLEPDAGKSDHSEEWNHWAETCILGNIIKKAEGGK